MEERWRRFVPFEGASIGSKLKGKVTGVDYLRVRADQGLGWVNGLQVRAKGTVDLAEQIVHLKGYSAWRRR